MFSPLLEAIGTQITLGLRPLNITEESIQITPDGKVYAVSGQVAISIFLIDMSPSELSGNAILSSDLSVGIGITTKGREIPVDRRGTNLYTDIDNKGQISIEEIAARVVRLIHGQFAVTNKANQLAERLGLSYCEPLFLARSIGTPEEKGPDHWNITEDDRSILDYNGDDLEGFYLELVFQGARCFQHALEFEPTVS